MTQGHSLKCLDLTTRWSKDARKCVPCALKPGAEVTPNCGYDDQGGRHERPFSECKPNTFNDGSGAYCQPCTSCPPGYKAVRCGPITDTQCQPGSTTPATGVPVTPASTQHVSAIVTKATTIQTSQGSSFTPNVTTVRNETSVAAYGVLWGVAFVFSIMVALLSVICIIYMKRNRGRRTVLCYSRKSSIINEGFSPLSAPALKKDLEDILSPDILAAPLQTVLDDLDVLEKLVILLDPDSHVLKGTKHLASHCSFPASWITYAYSMKDSKSPLKAVLEGVTSMHPDWTVGHLAKLFRQMERNDAISVLAQLRLNMIAV